MGKGKGNSTELLPLYSPLRSSQSTSRLEQKISSRGIVFPDVIGGEGAGDGDGDGKFEDGAIGAAGAASASRGNGAQEHDGKDNGEGERKDNEGGNENDAGDGRSSSITTVESKEGEGDADADVQEKSETDGNDSSLRRMERRPSSFSQRPDASTHVASASAATAPAATMPSTPSTPSIVSLRSSSQKWSRSEGAAKRDDFFAIGSARKDEGDGEVEEEADYGQFHTPLISTLSHFATPTPPTPPTSPRTNNMSSELVEETLLGLSLTDRTSLKHSKSRSFLFENEGLGNSSNGLSVVSNCSSVTSSCENAGDLSPGFTPIITGGSVGVGGVGGVGGGGGGGGAVLSQGVYSSSEILHHPYAGHLMCSNVVPLHKFCIR
jgi:hypothetical protein